MGLKTHLGGNVEVAYAQGYCREEKEAESDTNWQETSLENGGGSTKVSDAGNEELEKKRKLLREEAVRLAKEYETVIYIGGLNHDHDCEGNDRKDMSLPYEQDILIKELLQVKPDMIVVMIAGSAVDMTAWVDQADTLVWGWYAGMEGGNALAEVLLGEVNPSGKLPETFYKNHMDCSAHALGEFAEHKSVSYKEGRYVGYRYNEKYKVEPLFPFGYGLSYTTFAYRDMQVDTEKNEISLFVKNTGAVDGSEIVEVYRLAKEGEDAPVKELKGFEKVFLKAGEEKRITVQVEPETEERTYVIGSSLTDIRLK